MSWLDRIIPEEKRVALGLKAIEMKYGAMRMEAKINALLQKEGLDEMRKALDAEFEKRILRAKESGESIL